MSAPLDTYVDPREIRERLTILRDKRARIAAYKASCASGTPDVLLLDEKQQEKFAFYQQMYETQGRAPLVRFPWPIWHTLGQTIHILETRLSEINQRERWAA